MIDFPNNNITHKVFIRLITENMALRQQLIVYKRRQPRPRIRQWDRLFWVLLALLWKEWRKSLIFVKPESVIRWHRQGFKLFWAYKSRACKRGRPRISPEIRSLVLKMADENPLWGAPRIHGELLKLGIELSERSVSSILRRLPSSHKGQPWKTFLKNHATEICSMDFFTVPTFNFKLLSVLVILSHDRRRVVHYNITSHPTALWSLQQVREAFPWGDNPKYLIRDRDSIYGHIFQQGVEGMGIKQIQTSYKSPWQNGYVERVIGTIRRDCLLRPSYYSQSKTPSKNTGGIPGVLPSRPYSLRPGQRYS
jgi:transposase InsO family protein